jgi:hypothetical protein
MFCFNPKFSPFGGKMNNLKKDSATVINIPEIHVLAWDRYNNIAVHIQKLMVLSS